ncbi:uncharacterized protein [Chelonus insularis]|uniref:uncharacterized protein isoform X3 n=1 Tax=Chelonus insularis TaxID=460826 RepID=UPI00158E3120|nr:uncharacterized protein LOC118067759 isoform X3 [Chelonus insularis]
MSALPFALKLIYCCCCWFTCIILLIRPSCNAAQELLDNLNFEFEPRQRREVLAPGVDHQRNLVTTLEEENVYDEDTDMSYDENGDEDYFETNTTEKGRYLGAPCDNTCSPDLQHVFCDTVTGLCECEKFYPVRLGPTKGCAKPKKLGEQCFYRATCTFADQHATCTQVQHNAVCDCDEGYHKVAIARPNKRVFCAEDLVLISTDLPTLLGIASGIAVLSGLLCFVLKLFSRARYTRPRHYANANHAPPMLFSSDTGSRRPSLASIHSSVSSARSYSARRLERERNEKEQRQALQELRLAKQREQELQQQSQQQSAPTPSPRTPHSTDELLPSVEEGKEAFYNEQTSTTSPTSGMPSTSKLKILPQKTSLTMMSTSALMPGVSVKQTPNSSETAFTASTMNTSAFKKDDAEKCSNVVDIFES